MNERLRDIKQTLDELVAETGEDRRTLIRELVGICLTDTQRNEARARLKAYAGLKPVSTAFEGNPSVVAVSATTQPLTPAIEVTPVFKGGWFRQRPIDYQRGSVMNIQVTNWQARQFQVRPRLHVLKPAIIALVDDSAERVA